MTSTTSETSIRHQIDVAVGVDRAFAIFTERFDEIKPREHNPHASPIVQTVFERQVGGAIYDRHEDGSESRWSRVLAFDPPDRFVISWDLSPQWEIETDPSRTSEIEVRFTPIDAGHTRVELEHRDLDRHGVGWEGVREGVGGSNGWPTYLQRFADLTRTS